MNRSFRLLFPLFILLLSIACSTTQNTSVNKLSDQEAQAIVDRAILKHGGKKYLNSTIDFDFRKKHYRATRKKSTFQYERIFDNETGETVRDVLSNDGFYREINGKKITLTEKERQSWSGSVNSVHYFVQLPSLLNDPAVIKKYVGESTIKGKKYDKIEVRFKAENGGRDHEDVYLYWFDQSTYTMDYLAYNYLVNGGGARFREAYNVRTINGIRFADYVNYKPKVDNRNVAEFDQLFENDGLKELSKIVSENIQVK